MVPPLPFSPRSFFGGGGGGLSANNNIMGGDSARRVGRGGACCRMMYVSRWGRPNVPPRVGWVGGGGEGDIARRWRGDYTVRRLSLSGHNTNAKDNSPRCRAGGEEGASRRLWGVGYRPPSVVVVRLTSTSIHNDTHCVHEISWWQTRRNEYYSTIHVLSTSMGVVHRPGS